MEKQPAQDQRPTAAATDQLDGDGCVREKLKRHSEAVSGRVWIPESWGQEKLLSDWIDCAAIDRALVPNGLRTAREALMKEYCCRPPG